MLVLRNGQAILDLPWDAARALAMALRRKSALAEEIARHERVALDDAIMIRSGAPCRLAVDPRVRELAEQEAQSNRKLRRYMPSLKGIGSRERVGVPVVRRVDA